MTEQLLGGNGSSASGDLQALQDPHARPLAGLEVGRQARVAELRLAEGERLAAASPLRKGAVVYVVERARAGWMHVRIGYREYSMPSHLAERILVVAFDEDEGQPAAGSARDAYAVLFSREGRKLWRVRVIRRDTGTVVHNSLFDAEADARQYWGVLRGDAEQLDAVAFRGAHALP